MADSKRARLDELYVYDPRVAPWTGTAHGVLQAVNTWARHHATVRGSDRADRNAYKTPDRGVRPTGPHQLAHPPEH